MNNEFNNFFKIEGESQSIILEDSINPDPETRSPIPKKPKTEKEKSDRNEFKKLPKFITSESYFINESANSSSLKSHSSLDIKCSKQNRIKSSYS